MRVVIGIKEATYDDGTKLSDVATWNNYGTETIPPRPVFRIALEKKISSEEIKKHTEAYMKNLVNYALYNQGDLKEIEIKYYTALGSQVAAEAKRIIKGGTELQHNAPSTIRQKKSDKPLLDTGLLIKNIGYEVQE